MNRLLASIGESSIGSWARQNHMVTNSSESFLFPPAGCSKPSVGGHMDKKKGKATLANHGWIAADRFLLPTIKLKSWWRYLYHFSGHGVKYRTVGDLHVSAEIWIRADSSSVDHCIFQSTHTHNGQHECPNVSFRPGFTLTIPRIYLTVRHVCRFTWRNEWILHLYK